MSFLNLFKQANASLKMQIKRLSICMSCKDEKGNKNVYNSGQCKDCFCFIKEKVKHIEEKCPRNSW